MWRHKKLWCLLFQFGHMARIRGCCNYLTYFECILKCLSNAGELPRSRYRSRLVTGGHGHWFVEPIWYSLNKRTRNACLVRHRGQPLHYANQLSLNPSVACQGTNIIASESSRSRTVPNLPILPRRPTAACDERCYYLKWYHSISDSDSDLDSELDLFI
jgi:hypothetical protein